MFVSPRCFLIIVLNTIAKFHYILEEVPFTLTVWFSELKCSRATLARNV